MNQYTSNINQLNQWFNSEKPNELNTHFEVPNLTPEQAMDLAQYLTDQQIHFSARQFQDES
jgi:cytochrome c